MKALNSFIWKSRYLLEEINGKRLADEKFLIKSLFVRSSRTLYRINTPDAPPLLYQLIDLIGNKNL